MKRIISIYSCGLLLLLCSLCVSCKQVPSEEIQLKPGGCNIYKTLINNPSYLPHTLKAPPGVNPYADLFKDGFLYACAIPLWDDVNPSDTERNVRSDKDSFFSLIKILPNGTFEAMEPIEGTKDPILQYPSYPIKNARLHIYVVPKSLGTNPTEFKKQCSTTMKNPEFQCFAQENREKCLFYFRAYPQRNPPSKDFQTQASDQNCDLCVPEVCDGKDNDCDKRVDNLYGSPTKLTRPCYTGDNSTLLDETRGIGICKIGSQTCNGSWGECKGQQTPLAKEECNQKDDDCDGTIDEGNLCNKGYICRAGKCVVTPCREDETSCGKICAILSSDPQHCGACDNACASGELCSQGKCVTSCTRSTPAVCGRSCIDLQTNRNHCGKCDNKCDPGYVCFSGKCELSCPVSAPKCGVGNAATCCQFGCCDDQCVDTDTNPLHCGGCGKKCPSGSLCYQGSCRVECPSFAPKCGASGQELCCDKTCCADGCVDVLIDPYNCGQCGVRCKPGERCDDGECKLSCPTSAPKCGPPEKETCCSLSCCSDACVDLQNDRNNCGACGTSCKPGERCTGGQCILDCPTTAPECGPPNARTCCSLTCCTQSCVDMQNDRNHCGQCGNVCPGGQACIKGQCQFLCPTSQRLCGNLCIDISLNPNHCGGCNSACGAGERCENSTCELCPTSAPKCGLPGQETCCSLNCCNNQCVDIKNNPNHCGACGNKCGTGERCNNGTCELCPPSAKKCGSYCCSNTCCNDTCVDTSYHPNHCGACGIKCANGTTCCNGQCVDLILSKDHCGSCGTKCTNAQTCDKGKCCQTGQNSCGGQCVNLQNNTNHCGACGNTCPQGQICQAGSCECQGTQTKCGSVCINTQNNNNHCGACGNICPQGQICKAGVCSCPSGQLACGGLCIDPQTNNTHCGVCNNGCTNGRTCQSGQCLCPPGRSQCGGKCIDQRVDNAHCGACDNACTTGTLCCASSCVNPLTNNTHCGVCNNTCAAGKSCQNGTCQ